MRVKEHPGIADCDWTHAEQEKKQVEEFDLL